VTQTAQIHLRVPPRLHETLKAIAEQQDISMNQAIVLLLTSATAGFEFSTEGEE
jgi:predicted HicB family RNase H-like nuclease